MRTTRVEIVRDLAAIRREAWTLGFFRTSLSVEESLRMLMAEEPTKMPDPVPPGEVEGEVQP